MIIFACDMKLKFLLHLGSPGRAVYHFFMRRRLRNRSVSVISNNCWGGFIHRYCHIPFNTPFIGLFITAPDYIALLEDTSQLSLPLRFIPFAQSRYYSDFKHLKPYPVGVLPSGIEIHFMHYSSPEEAQQKWSRRIRRIDWDNAIVKFSDNDLCSPDLIRRFDRLPFKSKVCFTSGNYPDLKSVVTLPEFKGKPTVKSCWKYSERHYDFVDNANALLK